MVRALDLALKYLLIVMMAILTTSVFLQVLIRFVFRSPLPWTEEVARIAFVYMVFLGATIGVRQKAHIAVDFVVYFVPAGGQRLLMLLSNLAIALFLFVWIWQGIVFVEATGIQMTPVLQIPFAYLYVVIPVSGALMLFYLVLNAVDDLRGEEGVMTWLIGVLFAFFLVGVPIGFSLGVTSLVGLLVSGAPLLVLVQKQWAAVDSFALVAVPLFVLAGGLMSYGGFSRRLVDFADALIGHVTSGLAMVAVVACMFFAAVSGSAIADAAAIGGILIPIMVRQGYHAPFASALVASAGTIGPIIPPSIPMVIYGVMTSTSIAKLFAGGFLPGALMGVGLMAYSFYVGKKRGYRGRATRATAGEIVKGFFTALLALIMPIIIIGGIIGGVFTPTESGVVAVVYALVLGLFVYRELKLTQLGSILYETGLTSGTIIFIVANASLFSWLLTVQQIPQQLTAMILAMNLDKIAVLLVVNIVLLIAGTMIDTISALVIFTPLFLPIVKAVGVDPIHFGIIVSVNLTIGMITPPVGVCLFVTSKIGKVSIREMWPDLWPMIIVLVTVLGLITYVDSLSMWLPSMLK